MMPSVKIDAPPAYRLESRRAADALAVHLSRLPADAVLKIGGFRVGVEELHGIVCHAVAEWPKEGPAHAE